MGSRRHGLVRPAQETVIVGYHAPLPGSHTGVADYAERLLVELSKHGHIQTAADAADVHLYHLGNNRLHADIYRRALQNPGVVVLHDAVLHHFMLGAMTEEEYLAEWVHNYGSWHRPLGEELWRERAKAPVDPRYFEFPMLRRIVEASRAVIVHNSGAAAMARHAGAEHVFVIPHFYEAIEMPSGADVAQFRQRIGIAERVRLFGIFGYLREPKRVLACRKAFERLHALRPDTALLIAGEVVSGDLSRLLDKLEPLPAIRRLGHLEASDFLLAGAAVDCCLNLRYPSAGETSGIVIQMMGLGKPVILTRNAENADYPECAALRVSPDVAESEELFDHMVIASDFPALAREIGNQARNHILRHHALDSVARQYWEVLCSVVSLSF